MMLPLSAITVDVPEATGPGLDRASFREFYDDALPRIYGYFLHRTGGSPALADDLTQETFLAAVRELRRGRRPEVPIAWIHGIARHKLLDHYRRAERSERPLEDAPLAAGAPDIPHEAPRERMTEALAAVPASQRAALVLHYIDGFSMREAAELLGKTEKAVESLLGRGRESLKRAYLEVPE